MNRFGEYGKTGLFRYNTGWIYEEFLPELRGQKGIEAYKEMSENDDIIGAILFATETLMRQCEWSIQEASPSKPDKDAAEFVQSCMDDMEETWSDFISEVLSFLTYGWSYHEIVYKRRMGNTRSPETKSRYTDGLIGWRKLPIRSQDTLWEWKYDEKDNLIGMVQCAPPNYEQVFIPIEKALHFRTKSRKGNPEGRSVLRNCYRCFDEETEILTSHGWKKGTELNLTDEIATLNPQSFELEYQKPYEIHRYRHNGEMVRFKSRYIDQLVTTNHRAWVKKDKAKKWCIREASTVNESDAFMAYIPQNTAGSQPHIIPGIKIYQRCRNGKEFLREDREAISIPEDTWAAFMGIFLSEGYTWRRKYGNRQCIVGITQKKIESVKKIRQLLKQLPFCVYEHKNNKSGVITFEISNVQLYEHLKDTQKQTKRRAPEYIRHMSRESIRTFLYWYALGDGTTSGGVDGYKGTCMIATSSEGMADDLNELALLAGYESRKRYQMTYSNLGGRNVYSGIWHVSLGKQMEHNVHVSRENYHGELWCPTTENGIVLIRRNGKPSWSGNCWYFKRRIQEIEGIGIERDLAGLPVLEAPEGVDIWADEYADELAKAERIVSSVRRDEREGIVLGNGWKFTLTSTGGQRQFDTNAIIERYDTRMAMTVLADFVLLGHQNVGSFALSSNKTELFSVAMGAFLDLICETFNNQAIPRLIDINGDHFKGITDYPKLIHGDIETQDLGELGEFVSKMVGIGAITPDESMEDYLRMAADLPERDFEVDYGGNARRPGNNSDGDMDEDSSYDRNKTSEKPKKTNTAAGQTKDGEPEDKEAE